MKPRSVDANYISPHDHKEIDQQNFDNSFDIDNIDWLSIFLERNESIVSNRISLLPHIALEIYKKLERLRILTTPELCKTLIHNQIQISPIQQRG